MSSREKNSLIDRSPPQFLAETQGRASVRIVLTIFVSLLAKLLGFVRVQQIAATIGVGYHTDVLLVCFQLVWLFETVLISQAIVPMLLSRIYQVDRDAGSKDSVAFFLHAAFWCSLAAIAFACILYLFSDALSGLFLPETDDNSSLLKTLLLTSIATPLALASAHFLSLINRLTDNGVWYSVPQIIINLVALAGLILGFRLGGPLEATVGMMSGVLAGAVLTCCVQLLAVPKTAAQALKVYFKGKTSFAGATSTYRGFWSGVGILLFAALIQEAYIYIDFYFASSQGEGSVALVGFAARLANLANMLIVASAFVILEPRWARALTSSQPSVWRKVIMPDYVCLLFLLMSPVATLYFFAPELTKLIYNSDRFSSSDREALNDLTQIYGLYIFALGFTMVTTRLLILQKIPKYIVRINLSVLPLKIALSSWLVSFMGLPGLAIATVVVVAIQGSLNFVFLIRSGANIGLRVLDVVMLGSSCVALALLFHAAQTAFSGNTWLVAAIVFILLLINLSLAVLWRLIFFRGQS